MTEPFEQTSFDVLPETPRRGHIYWEAESQRVTVETDHFGAVETSVRVYGQGPPLLLVHGLMTSNYSWRYVFEPLGRTHRVYAPDLPGAGSADKPVDVAYTPTALADWIGAFQKTTGIRGCATVGNSLGGYLCMWLALRDSEAMRCLVNLHSPGISTLRLRALHTAMSTPGVKRFVAWMARQRPARWAHSHVHYYDETLKSVEEAEVYGEPLSSFEGSYAFARYLAEALDPEQMDKLCDELAERKRSGAGFPVPLLLVYAERDPMVPPEVGEELAERIPDATLVRMSEASHFAHVDDPERFVRRVREFLDRC